MSTPSPAGLRLAARATPGAGSENSSALVDLLALTARPEVLSFAVGLPDPELFDVEGLKAAFDTALTRPRAHVTLQYSPTEGLGELREVVAGRLSAGGLPTRADEILVTTGSQQALTLVAGALFDPGDIVLVEEPTYLAALEPFRLAGARAVPVASDEHGLVPEALEEALTRYDARAVYVVPTFANPTGRTLPPQRRARIAELVREHDVWLVEDDPYSQLRYRGAPVAAISADPAVADRSLYLGTFSKIGCPGLRIGWIRMPAQLVPAFGPLKQAADMHTSTLDQAAAAIYLAEADLAGHIDTVRAAYGARRDAMIAALPSTLPPGSTWSDPDGGMFVWARLPEGHDSTALLAKALAENVAFVPGAPFYAGEPDVRTLRMCFATYRPEIIADGMQRLRRALQR